MLFRSVMDFGAKSANMLNYTSLSVIVQSSNKHEQKIEQENASHTFCRSWPLINVPKINHVQESHSITYCVNAYCSHQVLFIDEWGRGVQFKVG